MKFEAATIRVPCQGFIAVGTGLGYYQHQDADDITVYSVVHTLSGHSLGRGPFCSEEHVRAYLEALAPLWDWNRSRDELRSDTNAAAIRQQIELLFDQYIFEDAAATGMGGAA